MSSPPIPTSDQPIPPPTREPATESHTHTPSSATLVPEAKSDDGPHTASTHAPAAHTTGVPTHDAPTTPPHTTTAPTSHAEAAHAATAKPTAEAQTPDAEPPKTRWPKVKSALKTAGKVLVGAGLIALATVFPVGTAISGAIVTGIIARKAYNKIKEMRNKSNQQPGSAKDSKTQEHDAQGKGKSQEQQKEHQQGAAPEKEEEKKKPLLSKAEMATLAGAALLAPHLAIILALMIFLKKAYEKSKSEQQSGSHGPSASHTTQDIDKDKGKAKEHEKEIQKSMDRVYRSPEATRLVSSMKRTSKIAAPGTTPSPVPMARGIDSVHAATAAR